MITSPHACQLIKSAKRGFTLLEVMIALTLGMMIMAAACSTFILLTKSAASSYNYVTMADDARLGLEYYSLDVKMGYKINKATSSELEIIIPTISDTIYETINYKFQLDDKNRKNPGSYKLTRTYYKSDGQTITKDLLRNIQPEKYQFVYYSTLSIRIPDAEVATRQRDIKEVQMDVKMLTKTLHLANTDYVISARYMMRNKQANSTL